MLFLWILFSNPLDYSELHSFNIHSMSIWCRQECLSICCGLVLLKKLIETSLRVSHSVLRLCGKGFEEEELLLFCGRRTDKHLRGDVDDDEDAFGNNDYKCPTKDYYDYKSAANDDLLIMMIRILFRIIIINVPQKTHYLWWEKFFYV